ncbi:MAG: hypothetical protein IPJ65_41740 [Archangiaceae bacterium]|nr:hypothetical protein [Archangiaceae bacterium]
MPHESTWRPMVRSPNGSGSLSDSRSTSWVSRLFAVLASVPSRGTRRRCGPAPVPPMVLVSEAPFENAGSVASRKASCHATSTSMRS